MVTARKSIGEKWALYVGRKALGWYWPLVLVLFGTILGTIYLFVFHERTHLAVLSVVFMLLALIYFERRNFYLIIEKQKEHIANLESKANKAKQDTDKSADP